MTPLLAAAAGAGADDHAVVLSKLAAGDYSRRGADTCLACHDESEPFPTFEIFSTRHGHPAVAAAPFGAAAPPAGLQCEACHGPVGEHGSQMLADGVDREPMISFGSRGNAGVAVENGMCLVCHEDYGRARWAGSAHDRAGVTCAECHEVHAARDAVTLKATQVAQCTTCHRDVAADALKRSSHPIRTHPTGKSPLICRDCHEPHGGPGDGLTRHAARNDTCYECHAEKRGPFLWEHAPAAEDCSICHVPHGSNQPALLARRAPQLCQSCHSAAGHRNFPQTTDGLPPRPTSEYLLGNACLNCHTEVHGSNHPSGDRLRR